MLKVKYINMKSLISSTSNDDNDKKLELMKQKLEVLKRIRFLQKSLIRISFKHDEGRSEIYLSLLSSLKLANQSLFKINQLTGE